MGKRSWKLIRFGLLCFTLFALSGCEEGSLKVTEGGTEITAEKVTATDPGSVVCSPFGSGSLGRHQGIRADLYYLQDSLPRYDSVAQYVANGTRVDATLFLDQLNIPTRPFDSGFLTNDGRLLTTPAGDTLYEWFALDMETEIRLTDADSIGRYQFALMSDDGALALYQDGDTWKTLVDNDGTHPTKLTVGREAISLDRQSRLPLRMKYYQGPRMHIAAMLLWRPWPEASGAWQDPDDGASSNDYFFNSHVRPSAPQPAYQALLSRGWRPVPAANFFLPSSTPENPCPAWNLANVAKAPARHSISVSWETPEHATSSRLVWGATATSLNNELSQSGARTSHSYQISGLAADTTYYLQGINRDEYNQEKKTEVLAVRTLAIDPPPNGDWQVVGFDASTTTDSATLIWRTPGAQTRATLRIGTSASDLTLRTIAVTELTDTHLFTVNGLAADTDYYFRADAEDENGRTMESVVIRKRTKP